MYDDETAETQLCAVCDKPARERVHAGCQQRMADSLRELPQLYRDLADALTPGRRGGDGRSGTRTAPIPCNLDSLDLRGRGGIEGVVGGWARDLCERERWDVPQHRSVEAIVDWSCAILLANLGVICDEHGAVREIADELRQITGQARRIITGEKAPIKVPVLCPCGNTLKITLDSPGERCRNCDAQYGHSELMHLPLAERRAA
jgi:hypothetical protein